MAGIDSGVAARAERLGRAVKRAEASGCAALEATVLRLRSREGLDVSLTLATSGREHDYRAWSDRATAEISASRTIGDELDPRWAATLARILALSRLEPSAETVALAIYRNLAARLGPDALESRDAQVYGQLLLESGALDELRACLPHLELRPVVRRMLLTDLAQLDVVSGRRPLSAWSSALQNLMELERLGFGLPDDTDPFEFDRISSRVDGELVDGPLITVVMPVFVPDAGLVTAVRSILDQTWRNLEVLIVDDASPAAMRHHFEEVGALDERIRVITKPRNGGTYAARNTALAAARGVFVTGQDADDWSHPERLERQVRPLLDDRSLVATLSWCLRVTDDLRTSTLRASGLSPTRVNSSSLMFRRIEVMHRIGYYDRVRKGADSEFIFRIRTVFGKKAMRELRECLALVRLATGSLSRTDFLPGWHHESRVWYREMYTHWHLGIRRGGSPFLEIDRRKRPFPSPESFVSGDSGKLEVDCIFVADLREQQPGQERILDAALQLAAKGRRVGVAHLEGFDSLETARRGLDRSVLDAVSKGELALVEWSRETCAEHVIVWPAELTEFHGDRQPRWRTGRVSLVVEGPVALSAVPALLLRLQASASWVARNLRLAEGIDLIAPVAREPAASEFRRDDDAPLEQVGWAAPQSDCRELVLVEPAGHPASLALDLFVEALAVHGVTARLSNQGMAGDALSHFCVAEAGRTLEVAPAPHIETDGLSLFVSVADDQRGSGVPARANVAGQSRSQSHKKVLKRALTSGDGVQLMPAAQPANGVWPPSQSGTASTCRASMRTHNLASAATVSARLLPFVAVAGGLGVDDVRGWSSHTIEGVQYWSAGDGAALAIPLAIHHRLRMPACVVAIEHRGEGVDEISGWFRAGIEDPSSALTMLGGDRARAALAVHDSYLWTIHSMAPEELVCVRNELGPVFAVATEEPVLSAFLAALRETVPPNGEQHVEHVRVSRFLRGVWHPVEIGWVRGDAVSFSSMHGGAFVPVAELPPDRAS